MNTLKNISVYLSSIICYLILGIFYSFANTNNDSITKVNYQQAYGHLNNMLSEKSALSLEDAIFTIENAYADNQLSKIAFTNSLDFHTQRILLLAEANSQPTTHNPQPTTHNPQLLFNWAIFTYMTDTTYWKQGNDYLPNYPMVYNKEDPYGTDKWENTFVTTLLNPEKKSGNCFSLAVLYKIFSDRMQSEAFLSTAPQHIYIQHKGFDDNFYNIELTTRTFPGSGTIKTYTYTTHDAVTNGIAMRRLNKKEEIALCLVYLAKGLEKKLEINNYELGIEGATFSLQCAETALQYDSLCLNALLLKAQALEELIQGNSNNNYQTIPSLLEGGFTNQSLEATLFNLYDLGYRQMPQNMQANLLAHNQGSTPFSQGRRAGDEGFLGYYTLSNNTFPEIIQTNNIVAIGNTTIDIQSHKICNINTTNNTNITDPIAFALSIDPLVEKFPSMSPYNSMGNNPINCIDPDGKEIYFVAQKGSAPVAWGSPAGIQYRQDHIDLEIAYATEVGKAGLSKYIGNTGHDVYLTFSDQFVNDAGGVTATKNDNPEMIAVPGKLKSDFSGASACGDVYEAFEDMKLKSSTNNFALVVLKSGGNNFMGAAGFLHEIIGHVDGLGHDLYGEEIVRRSDFYNKSVNADGTPTPANLVRTQVGELSRAYDAAETKHDRAESLKRTQSLAEGIPYAKVPYTHKMFLDGRKSASAE